MSFDNDIDFMDSIEACRTCGVFFLTSSSFLRQIFTSAVDDPEMLHIRMELTAWDIEINENDGYPQFICTGCIHEFQKVFKFRRSCIDIQDQLRHYYNVRTQNQNQIQIKTEINDEAEENCGDFIYVDDLSDTEYDGTTPFNITHVPIKEEIFEAAVPLDTVAEAMDSANTNIESESVIETAASSSNIAQEIDAATMPTEAAVENNTLQQQNINAIIGVANFEAQTPDACIATVAQTTSTSIKCEYCNCISLNMLEHRLHLKRIHETRDMECHVCGKQFKNSSVTRLNFHLKWHKISKHVKCAQCGLLCNSREMLREHTRQIHARVKCSVCGKTVLSKRMKAHMISHGLDTLFECTYCSKVFTTSAAVTTHITKAHTSKPLEGGGGGEGGEQDGGDVDNSFVELACAICDQKFINKIELKVHVQEEHLGSGNIDINKCAEDYSLMYSTNTTVTTDDNCSNYQEEEEEEEEESSYSVAVNDEPVQAFCPNCQQNFYNTEELAEHVAQCLHAYEDNGRAELYHSSYNGTENEYNKDDYQQNQSAHMQENMGCDDDDDKDYGCGAPPLPDINDVDKILTNDNGEKIEHEVVEDLNQHNFGCAQCADTFENVEQLRDHHDRSHPKKSNFKCDVCDKVFELKFSLNRHMKKHEKI